MIELNTTITHETNEGFKEYIYLGQITKLNKTNQTKVYTKKREGLAWLLFDNLSYNL